MSDPITVLIVDDEPPARRRIRALLEAEPHVRIAGECGNGRDAIEAIEQHRPDLVFLDVQMPEADGFEVLRALDPERMPVVVFVTAYDQYALQAFDAHALDYVLKPFDRERFATALRRAAVQVQRTRAEGTDARLRALVQELRGEPGALQRLAVRVGSRIRLVDVGEVDYFEADSNYVRVHVGERSHLIRETLSALEGRLDPTRFLRVHRSLILNLSRVVEVEPLFAGEYVLFLRGGVRLTSGRTYRARVQEALGLRA